MNLNKIQQILNGFQKTPRRLSKLGLNKKIVSIIKFHVICLFILSCSDEKIKLNNAVGSLGHRTNINDIEKYKQINCNSTNGCYIPDSTCYCHQTSCCTRQDLDPCYYSDGLQFAKAVACELTKVANGCYEQQYQFGCVEVGSPICLDLGDPSYTTVPSSLTAIVSGGNPFQFCSEALCDEYTCNSGTYPLHHFTMTVAYQNALLSWLRSIGTGIWSCENGYTFAGLKMEFRVCNTGSGCNNTNKTSSCHDLSLIVRFHSFYCCPQ
ncbi:MAG: hypothetical protein ABI851_11845 [Saprospiraceae bacterium]